MEQSVRKNDRSEDSSSSNKSSQSGESNLTTKSVESSKSEKSSEYDNSSDLSSSSDNILKRTTDVSKAEDLIEIIRKEIEKYYYNPNDKTIGEDLAPYYYCYEFAKPEYKNKAVHFDGASTGFYIKEICTTLFNDINGNYGGFEDVDFNGCCGKNPIITGDFSKINDFPYDERGELLMEAFEENPEHEDEIQSSSIEDPKKTIHIHFYIDDNELEQTPAFDEYNYHYLTFKISGDGKEYKWLIPMETVKVDGKLYFILEFGW